jgi:putative membrane protein
MKFEAGGKSTWRAVLGAVLCASAFAVAVPANAQTDGAFLRNAVEGGNFEVQVGQLAERNAGSEQVRLLGYMIASDHARSDDSLRQLAFMEKASLSTESLAYSRKLQQLGRLHGAAFDKAFLQTITASHKADIAVFLREAKNGKDVALRQFASGALPTLQKHLSMAQQLRSQLGQ